MERGSSCGARGVGSALIHRHLLFRLPCERLYACDVQDRELLDPGLIGRLPLLSLGYEQAAADHPGKLGMRNVMIRPITQENSEGLKWRSTEVVADARKGNHDLQVLVGSIARQNETGQR